jgi:hypothetical protein
MTPMKANVNDLDDDTRRTIDVVVPPPATLTTVRRRWVGVLAVAAVFVFAWQAGFMRPSIDSSYISGQGSNWNTDSALVTLTVMVRNDGLSPVEVTGFEFDERWGTVISATTPERRPLPTTIGRDELVGFLVTVQAAGRGCVPPSALAPEDRPSSLLTMTAATTWFPLSRSVTLPGIDHLADMALTSICTGDF